MYETQRGVALIAVLWLIILLSGLVGAFALSGQVERLAERVQTRDMVLRGAARAGVEYALVRIRLQDPEHRWWPDGRSYAWQYRQAEVELRITDERGKVDVNKASHALLAALLGALHVAPAEAARVASAIDAWRRTHAREIAGVGRSAVSPAGTNSLPFESVADLQRVLDVTAAEFALLEPHVTVYSGQDQPTGTFASPQVQEAIAQVAGRSPSVPSATSQAAIWGIESCARWVSGQRHCLRTVWRVARTAAMARRPLYWSEHTL